MHTIVLLTQERDALQEVCQSLVKLSSVRRAQRDDAETELKAERRELMRVEKQYDLVTETIENISRGSALGAAPVVFRSPLDQLKRIQNRLDWLEERSEELDRQAQAAPPQSQPTERVQPFDPDAHVNSGVPDDVSF
jgi:hypothetical protein